MAEYETSVMIATTPERLFDFLIRPTNLLKISPPETKLKFLSAPEEFATGCRFEFQISAIGPVQRITHEITHLNRPLGFTERQVSGPLKHFRHEHILESNGDTHVRLINRIEFEPPGGLAGFLITESWIRDSLEAGFEHRHRELKRIIEQAP